MRLTLSLYVGRLFLFWFGAVFFGFVGLVYLLDLIELLRRTQRIEIPFGVLMQLSAFKLPHLVMELIPFAVLFAAILCFWRLARNHELTVVRAAGVSVWQFLLPAVVLAVAIGALRVGVMNPVAAALYARYEVLEAEMIRGRTSQLAVSQSGFWLRQAGADGSSMIHALRVASRKLELHDVIIWSFEPNTTGAGGDGADRFLRRVDAKRATLEPGAWLLSEAWVTGPERAPVFESSYRLATDMTPERIQDAFAAPETISFWDLPGFIQTLETAGFHPVRHLLHLHRLLTSPLLLLAMVLIAATVSLRPPRRGGTMVMVVAGISAGFLLYFLSNLLAALGVSRAIPVHLAAWAPATISMLLGVSLLLHQEDG